MRKITSKSQEEKKLKQNRLILTFILVFLMFFSVLGYAFQLIANQNTDSQNQVTQKVTYNGYEFNYQNGFWITLKDGSNFIFKNNPYDVPRINSHINFLENYIGKKLYINSNSLEAESEIRTNLAGVTESIENACLNGENCTSSDNIRTCDDNFIIIKEKLDNVTKIEQSKNCVFIEGNIDSLTKVTDEFLFKILKIDNYL